MIPETISHMVTNQQNCCWYILFKRLPPFVYMKTRNCQTRKGLTQLIILELCWALKVIT